MLYSGRTESANRVFAGRSKPCTGKTAARPSELRSTVNSHPTGRLGGASAKERVYGGSAVERTAFHPTCSIPQPPLFFPAPAGFDRSVAGRHAGHRLGDSPADVRRVRSGRDRIQPVHRRRRTPWPPRTERFQQGVKRRTEGGRKTGDASAGRRSVGILQAQFQRTEASARRLVHVERALGLADRLEEHAGIAAEITALPEALGELTGKEVEQVEQLKDQVRTRTERAVRWKRS